MKYKSIITIILMVLVTAFIFVKYFEHKYYEKKDPSKWSEIIIDNDSAYVEINYDHLEYNVFEEGDKFEGDTIYYYYTRNNRLVGIKHIHNKNIYDEY